jgi:ubiquinone/menaquinone biosynthesis C-methylase UbiE
MAAQAPTKSNGLLQRQYIARPGGDRQFAPEFAHLAWLKREHPRAYGLLDSHAVSDEARLAEHFRNIGNSSGHFDFKQGAAGRGDAYRNAQNRYPLAREFGLRKLFWLFRQTTWGLAPNTIVVDLLGGNGTLTRGAMALLSPAERPYIVTSEPCWDMVADTVRQNLPVVQQTAQSTLFRSSSLTVAFAGYGLHHIGRPDRPQLAAEAWRILKPGGRVVLHDFETGTATARWYSEALHAHTSTGHAFDHFSQEELRTLLSDAGFQNVRAFNVYDPFILYGPSAGDVHQALLLHLTRMFGLAKLAQGIDETDSDYIERLDAVLASYAAFSPSEVAFEPDAVNCFSVRRVEGVWKAEFPRVALVATATKPN